MLADSASEVKHQNASLFENLEMPNAPKVIVSSISPKTPYCEKGSRLTFSLNLRNVSSYDFMPDSKLKQISSFPNGLKSNPSTVDHEWKAGSEEEFQVNIQTSIESSDKYVLCFRLNSPFSC
jgi:hypothetical protein